MPQPGQTLSHYRLVEKIGQGGMGEVWRATDTRLDREVALKLLPDLLARDGGRLDRFAREAKLLASLNHPGIATIHDVDEHEGVRFLVMELVPGDDLSQALERGALPLAEALDAAVQIARAVEAAHGQGVVHRDLKPANVKRASDGRIKVLDFGLAKAMEPDPASGGRDVAMSPTVTSAGTVAGMILGTAAYMSPEQARGREIDKRTDVWSFGVVLYELLTGDNPFRGDTVADSVGAIMHRDPDLNALPPHTPTAVRRLLRRCLTRERDARLHDIADARIELEEAIANPVVETPGAVAAAAPPPSKLPWIALAVLVPLAAVAAWWAGSRGEAAPPKPLRQFELQTDVDVSSVMISPDGARFAYSVGNDLFIRSLDTLESRKIAESDSFGRRLAMGWSPDGRSIVYNEIGGEIKRIDLAGGNATTLTTRPAPVGGLTWSDDGFIYFNEFEGGTLRLPETGGAAEEYVARHDAMLDYHGMEALPGGRGIVTIPHFAESENAKILLDRPGEESVIVYESDSTIDGVTYSPTGHLVFHRDDDPSGLWALPFSLSSLSATGPPFLVVPDLNGASFSRSGDLIYTRQDLAGAERSQRIVWTDRTGAVVDRIDLDVYGGSRPVPSPDGSRMALIAKGIGQAPKNKPNLWVVDVERGTATRLTEDGTRETPPVWSEDGTRIAFFGVGQAGKGELFAVTADGSGTPELLTTTETAFFFSLTRDWSRLAVMSGSMNSDTMFDISSGPLDDPAAMAAVVAGPRLDAAPAIHPSGDWVAYMSGDVGNFDVYVRRFPSGEGQWKVSVENGFLPIWSADGKKLYYFDQRLAENVHELMEVDFDASGSSPKLGAPVPLFTVNAQAQVTPTANGRFVYVAYREPEGEEAEAETKGIVLIQNWLSRFGDS